MLISPLDGVELIFDPREYPTGTVYWQLSCYWKKSGSGTATTAIFQLQDSSGAVAQIEVSTPNVMHREVLELELEESEQLYRVLARCVGGTDGHDNAVVTRCAFVIRYE